MPVQKYEICRVNQYLKFKGLFLKFTTYKRVCRSIYNGTCQTVLSSYSGSILRCFWSNLYFIRNHNLNKSILKLGTWTFHSWLFRGVRALLWFAHTILYHLQSILMNDSWTFPLLLRHSCSFFSPQCCPYSRGHSFLSI